MFLLQKLKQFQMLQQEIYLPDVLKESGISFQTFANYDLSGKKNPSLKRHQSMVSRCCLTR